MDDDGNVHMPQTNLCQVKTAALKKSSNARGLAGLDGKRVSHVICFGGGIRGLCSGGNQNYHTGGKPNHQPSTRRKTCYANSDMRNKQH